MSEEWLSDTRRVIQSCGKGLGVHLKKEIVDTLEIQKGHIVEIKIRNTEVMSPSTKEKKESPEDIKETPREVPALPY